MKRVAVLTSGRQDWGILRSTALLLRDDPRFDLRLLVGGLHCSDAFGRTERLIQDEGFLASERLDWLADDPDAARAAGRALSHVAGALHRQQPDGLLLVGDRSETASAAIAATIEGVPIVHLHGGEETGGAFDNALRHAITKLSHLHLVSHPDHALRVIAMGERPDTVHVVGAPGLDNLQRTDLPNRQELEEELGIALDPPVVVVTVQPTTLAVSAVNRGEGEARAVALAMDQVPATYVVTLPNNDPGHEAVRHVLRNAGNKPRRVATEALGERRYWGLLWIADSMLGNSSSGLIEAPAVKLPVVNVGDRQLGRLRGANVIDVAADPSAIAIQLARALEPSTRRGLANAVSPYGDGHSGPRILEILLLDAAPASQKGADRDRRGWNSGMTDRRDLILIGGGEHARVVLDAARRSGEWQVRGYVDPVRSAHMERAGIEWLGDDAAAQSRLGEADLVIALGGFSTLSHRRALANAYEAVERRWASVVHPAAVIGDDVEIGTGVVVLALAVINPGARVAPHAILNSRVVVEHDVVVGAFSHVAPGAVIGGGARLGEGVLIGLNATVRDHVTVGDGAIVGMGAVVVGSVGAGEMVLGNPARSVGRVQERASENAPR